MIFKFSGLLESLVLLLIVRSCCSIPDIGGGSCLTPYPWSDSGPYFVYQDVPSELCLTGPILPSFKYEIKLSFREPEAKFALSLSHRTLSSLASRSPPGSRRPSTSGEFQSITDNPLSSTVLFDSEKLEFWTNHQGNVLLCNNGSAMLTISCQSLPLDQISLKIEATARNDAISRGRRGLWFHVRLDPVYLGFLPARALSLIIAVPFALLLTLCSVYLLLSKFSPLYQDKVSLQ
jgi:hypothetical protein